VKTFPREIHRRLMRQRRIDTKNNIERVVGIDQSLSNCACVLFVNGAPTDRVVFHTGCPTTKNYKDKIRRGDTIFGKYIKSPTGQVEYITSEVMKQMVKWNPHKVCLEGLAFAATGMKERQLAGLYHSIITCLHRELDYCLDKDLITVTPTQVKKIGREQLPEEKQHLQEWTSRGKQKLNPMKKKDMVEALQCTEHAWLLEGYTRSTLVASRKMQTGWSDIPDAYYIGKFYIENKQQFNKQYKGQDM